MSKHTRSACLLAHILSASPCRGERSWGGLGGSRRITIEPGVAEIKRFYFCCNWEKGAPRCVSFGSAAPDSVIHFPFVLSRGPLKYLERIPP